VACFIVEPVQGEGGFQALDAAFAQDLRRFCDAHGILLIIDEIQSGFGRSGQRFAFSRLGIEPDLLLLGKSMAGGLPLAAVVGRRELMDALPKGGLGGTYSGNPIACAAALATLEEMSDANLATWGELQERTILARYTSWQQAPWAAAIGRLTGVGAMRGIELRSADGGPGSERLASLLGNAREQGLLLMPSGKQRHIIRLLAPLTTEPERLDEGFDIFERCLAQLD
jgi:4-aminobutyrate aminotransferase / (S)-3-amino-2-methylpropionate transaminase / 5-aminovalerate transaminase